MAPAFTIGLCGLSETQRRQHCLRQLAPLPWMHTYFPAGRSLEQGTPRTLLIPHSKKRIHTAVVKSSSKASPSFLALPFQSQTLSQSSND